MLGQWIFVTWLQYELKGQVKNLSLEHPAVKDFSGLAPKQKHFLNSVEYDG